MDEVFGTHTVPSEATEARSGSNLGRLRRRDVLGGLIHEYEYAA
jgi:hypothetical protein